MVLEWCRFAAAVLCLGLGLGFMVLAVFGVNRFHRALNRMHAAAMGDTLGILFVFLGLILVRGFSLDSLKLFLVILFFWMASPVSGHMVSRLEAMTDEDLGEILVLGSDKEVLRSYLEEEKEVSRSHLEEEKEVSESNLETEKENSGSNSEAEKESSGSRPGLDGETGDFGKNPGLDQEKGKGRSKKGKAKKKRS